jgi:hypothetical protein
VDGRAGAGPDGEVAALGRPPRPAGRRARDLSLLAQDRPLLAARGRTSIAAVDVDRGRARLHVQLARGQTTAAAR